MIIKLESSKFVYYETTGTCKCFSFRNLKRSKILHFCTIYCCNLEAIQPQFENNLDFLFWKLFSLFWAPTSFSCLQFNAPICIYLSWAKKKCLISDHVFNATVLLYFRMISLKIWIFISVYECMLVWNLIVKYKKLKYWALKASNSAICQGLACFQKCQILLAVSYNTYSYDNVRQLFGISSANKLQKKEFSSGYCSRWFLPI